MQQEESSRRITTSQTAQQAVEPIRPNFIRQPPPLQTITIPPPDRRRNADGTTWDATQFFGNARSASAAAANIDPETSTAVAEPSSAAAATLPDAQELQDQSASIHDTLATLAAVAAQGTDGGEAMNTLIALASQVLDYEQDPATPRR